MKASLHGIVVTTYEHESECSIHDQDEAWMMLREVSNSLLMLVSKWAKCRSKPYMIAIRKERKKRSFARISKWFILGNLVFLWMNIVNLIFVVGFYHELLPRSSYDYLIASFSKFKL